MERPVSKGNLLGTPRAEADALLDRAFIETRDYHALVFTSDFSFVVGRRGAGKSALFRKTREYFASQAHVILLSDNPPEHETLELQHILSRCNAYRLMRAAAKRYYRRPARQRRWHSSMSSVVLDASAAVELFRGVQPACGPKPLRNHQVAVPAHFDAEVLSSLARLARRRAA